MPLPVLTTVSDVKSCVLDAKAAGKTIAFVPTMGALHPGHISLIEAAKGENRFVVASIFVNPTQFNNAGDLKNYPRTLEHDIEMLEAAGCDMLFAPSVLEIYPTPDKGHWDYGILSSSLEGKFRPGHFDGVLTVVKRLFEIVTPQISYFGEKDFQQLSHIRRFAKEEMPQIEIVGCPTLRESDGLAMSSRNMRLSAEERNTALHISRVLYDMREKKDDFSPAELEVYGRTQLELVGGMELEYLEIVDESTFAPVPEWGEPFQPIILVAAYVGEVRLIDNMKLDTSD